MPIKVDHEIGISRGDWISEMRFKYQIQHAILGMSEATDMHM